MALAGALRHPAGNPALHQSCRRPLRPAARCAVEHARHLGAVRSGSTVVDPSHRQGRRGPTRRSASWQPATCPRRACPISRAPDFKGKWYHSGLWPHEGVDFTGLRVGVIGTGSSGVQMIPLIAQQASHLHVFQRTANFSLPARTRRWTRTRETPPQGGIPRTPHRRLGHAVRHRRLSGADQIRAGSDAGRTRRPAYEAKWAEGGSISFLYSYTDLLVNKEANDTARSSCARRSAASSRTRSTAELLAPKDHPIGTKRLVPRYDYYETYNRDNVTLVDVRSDADQEITATGVRTGNAEYERRCDRLCHRLRRDDRRAARDRHPRRQRTGAGGKMGTAGR